MNSIGNATTKLQNIPASVGHIARVLFEHVQTHPATENIAKWSFM